MITFYNAVFIDGIWAAVGVERHFILVLISQIKIC